MKSLTEQPAVLSVHRGMAGQYVLRISDLQYRPLVIGVTKLLPDASSFLVVTPSDIRLFTVNSDGATAAPAEVADAEPDDADLDPETRAAIAAEESRAVPGAVVEGDGDAAAAAETEEVVPAVKNVRRRKPSAAPVAGHDDQCGRCGGSGKARVILDGGGGAETACPICKGTGTMRRYGARR
jgi:hypothetical protein